MNKDGKDEKVTNNFKKTEVVTEANPEEIDQDDIIWAF
jgi:hypothetical protein